MTPSATVGDRGRSPCGGPDRVVARDVSCHVPQSPQRRSSHQLSPPAFVQRTMDTKSRPHQGGLETVLRRFGGSLSPSRALPRLSGGLSASRAPGPGATDGCRTRSATFVSVLYVIWLIWLPGLAAVTSIYQHASTPARHEPALRSASGAARAGHRCDTSPASCMLAAAYYGAAKVGQTLRYTASVSAIWPPAGLGIAALYLWGLRWWPGVLLGELVVNARAAARRQRVPGRKPARPAGRQHGRDRRRARSCCAG